MKINLIWILFLTLSFSSSAFCEERLPLLNMFTSIPETSKDTLKTSFSKDSLPYWGIILGTTGILYRYDEDILRETQKKGRDLRVGNHDNTRSAISFGGQELLRLPSDTGSALYFLGDGWLHAAIGSGFIGYGKTQDNTRAYNTGVMILHGMFVSTIFNQTLKRSFGRESPEVKTSKRGSWNLFPSFNEYNSRTASYDAMPTGHVMTATLTFTILSERYPEYQSFIYPFAGVWITALGLQMINNGVHWASDYPLGIAMGYVIGKASTRMLNEKSTDSLEKKETGWMFLPTINGDVKMVTASRSF